MIYDPTPSGRPAADRRRLPGSCRRVGHETSAAPPQLMGQLFHLFEAPNRFGLPAFYTLHVWAWKENPNGAFVNWHPNVSCQTFSGQAPESRRLSRNLELQSLFGAFAGPKRAADKSTRNAAEPREQQRFLRRPHSLPAQRCLDCWHREPPKRSTFTSSTDSRQFPTRPQHC